jgi:hypothetical protein
MIASKGPFPQTQRAVAFVDRDILVTEPLHPFAGKLGELEMPLDGDHLVHDLRQHSGSVTGARAHFEHLVRAFQLRRLEHERNDIRLGNGLVCLDRAAGYPRTQIP